jgi:O-antigen/teichoic acid export membrane protein
MAYNFNDAEFSDFTYLKNILTLTVLLVIFSFDRTGISVLQNFKNAFSSVIILRFFIFIPTLLIIFCLVDSLIVASSLSIITFLNIFNIKHFFDFNKNIKIELLYQLLKICPLLIIFIFLYHQTKISIELYFVLTAIGIILYTFASWIYVKPFQKQIFNKIDLRQSITIFKVYFISVLSIMLGYLHNYQDFFIIRYLLDDNYAGIYAKSYLIYFGYNLAINSVFIRSQIAKHFKNFVFDEFYIASKKIIFFGLSIIFISVIFLYFNINIVKNLLRNFTSQPDLLIINFFILQASSIILSFGSFFGSYLLAHNKSYDYIKIMALSATINFLLNIIFIYNFGFFGAAIAFFISNFVAVFYSIFLFKKYFKLV